MLQILFLMLASMVAGASLLLLLAGWVARLFDDDSGSGCIGTGLVLLAIAAAIAIRAVIA
jgi:hypothetical protein